MLSRRQFLLFISGALGPCSARAQQPKLPLVGFVSSRSPQESASVIAAFRHGLGEMGYFEGQNVRAEYRWAEGHYERLPQFAAEIVTLKATVIAAAGDAAALAAKEATSDIPIVFVSGGDPQKLGVVTNLARPEGNVTGVTLFFGETGSKRLQILAELIPDAKSIGILVNPRSPSSWDDASKIARAATSMATPVLAFTERGVIPRQ